MRQQATRVKEEPMIRSFLTVSSGTLASRLLGFARDTMIAALLGAGPVADAFLVAFQLVNVVRRLLTEGALNAALVPAWLRLHETEGATAAAAFAGRVLGTVSAALIAAAALIGLLMPLILTTLAPGFAGHPTLQMAIDDARLMLPYLAFAGPVTVMMALMNAQHRFALSTFLPWYSFQVILPVARVVHIFSVTTTLWGFTTLAPIIRLSRTVRLPKVRAFCHVRATPSRARYSDRSPSTRCPETWMMPASAGTKPVTRLKSEVLPAPFGPIRLVIVPASTLKSTPCNTVLPAKARVTSLTVSRGTISGGSLPARCRRAGTA